MTTQIQIVEISNSHEVFPQHSQFVKFAAAVDAIAYVTFSLHSDIKIKTALEEISYQIGRILPPNSFYIEQMTNMNAHIVFHNFNGGLYDKIPIRVFLHSLEDLFLFELNFPKKDDTIFSA